MDAWACIRSPKRWAERLTRHQPQRWEAGLRAWQVAHAQADAVVRADGWRWAADGLIDWGLTLARAVLHGLLLTPLALLWLALATPEACLQTLHAWGQGSVNPVRSEQALVLCLATGVALVSFFIQSVALGSLGRRMRRRRAALRTLYLLGDRAVPVL